jgi:hypothetical protein
VKTPKHSSFFLLKEDEKLARITHWVFAMCTTKGTLTLKKDAGLSTDIC